MASITTDALGNLVMNSGSESGANSATAQLSLAVQPTSATAATGWQVSRGSALFTTLGALPATQLVTIPAVTGAAAATYQLHLKATTKFTAVPTTFQLMAGLAGATAAVGPIWSSTSFATATVDQVADVDLVFQWTSPVPAVGQQFAFTFQAVSGAALAISTASLTVTKM